MATPTKAQLATARSLLIRAAARFNGTAAAATRPDPTEGEFDNNFDGVVTGIFHAVDALRTRPVGGVAVRSRSVVVLVALIALVVQGCAGADHG